MTAFACNMEKASHFMFFVHVISLKIMLTNAITKTLLPPKTPEIFWETLLLQDAKITGFFRVD